MRTPTRSRLVRAEEHAWDEWLHGARSDVFHSSGYHLFAQGSGEGEPYLAIVGDRERGIIWPYLLRRLSDIPEFAGWDGTDVHSVYGYPGPVAWGCAPGDAFVAKAWEEIRGIWREQRVVCAFTRFHPLLENAALLAELPGGSLVSEGSTVSVDVTASDEAVRGAYGRDLRREIDAARRRGLVTDHDEGWEGISTFTRLYRDTMLRAKAIAYYFFDEADFRRLHACLPLSVHLLVTRMNGETAAAGLFTESGGMVQCFLMGSSDVYRSLSPSKVLIDDSIRWARDRGNKVMHLGGGRGGHEDSLFWFKSRFSPARHRFHTGRWILDAGRYQDLVDTHRREHLHDSLSDPAFFPAYRVSGRPSGPGHLTHR